MPALPPATVRLTEEFLGGTQAQGQLGELGWFFTNGAMTSPTAVAGHPGVVRRTSGTTINQVATLGLSGATKSFLPDITDWTWIVRPVDVTDVTTRIGLIDANTSDPPANGVYLERLTADTNWFLVTRAAATQTRVDTGVAYSATWLKAAFVNANGTVSVSINGGAPISSNTNLPTTTSLMPLAQIIPALASARSMDFDHFTLGLSVVR